MTLSSQKMEADERRAKEEKRRLNEHEWRVATRSEDSNWRTLSRKEDLTWRQAVRTEDLEARARETELLSRIRAEDVAWRQKKLNSLLDETREANRRSALLAAVQSLKPGSDMKSILKLASQYLSWIDSAE